MSLSIDFTPLFLPSAARKTPRGSRDPRSFSARLKIKVAHYRVSRDSRPRLSTRAELNACLSHKVPMASTRPPSNIPRDETPFAAAGSWDHAASRIPDKSNTGSMPFPDDRSFLQPHKLCHNCKAPETFSALPAQGFS